VSRLVSQDDPAEIDDFFHRVSYLCKAATKDYGSRCRAFSAVEAESALQGSGDEQNRSFLGQ